MKTRLPFSFPLSSTLSIWRGQGEVFHRKTRLPFSFPLSYTLSGLREHGEVVHRKTRLPYNYALSSTLSGLREHGEVVHRKTRLPFSFPLSSTLSIWRGQGEVICRKTRLPYNYALSYTLSIWRGQGEVIACRRNPATWSYENLAPLANTNRGYTGHEHLEAFHLINANARLYDPVCARFLSPDNYVQSPANSTGFNRYAYCMNNPVVNVDPSGEIAWFIPVIIGAAIGAELGGTWSDNWTHWAPWNWEDQQKSWEAAAVGAIIGGSIGAGYAAAGGWAAKGTVLWNGFQNGFLTADVNVLSSVLRGQDFHETFVSASSGFIAGFIGGATCGPISESKGIQSPSKSKFWNLLQGKEYGDVSWSIGQVRKMNSVTGAISGFYDRFRISYNKGYGYKSVFHGFLGATEGVLSARYFTGNRFFPKTFLATPLTSTVSYGTMLLGSAASQAVTSVPGLGFDFQMEKGVNSLARGIYKGNSFWGYVDYALTLAFRIAFLQDYLGSYPGYKE
ncbi:MAG: RHS repeat-associated core domain-containing protein [Bacteroidetes bacterium]|nr:RHS repeat-associated core domain-containing protein [Bacteroidota bacterium]